MIEYTIDDAISKCRDRANISALHHMMHASQEWEQTAVWLELLRDAPAIIESAKLGYARIYDSDTVQDVRDRQKEQTIRDIIGMLEDMSA